MKPNKTIVVLVTGHPATGKTILAKCLTEELQLPLIAKDHIKETLMNVLGWSTPEWSRQLGVATWALLYQHIETLSQANISYLVEGNFDPAFANAKWRELCQRYPLNVIQVRCEAPADILLARYRGRIEQGNRHPGHLDSTNDQRFYEKVKLGPLDWVDIPGERISVDTTYINIKDYNLIAEKIKTLMSKL